MIIRAVGVASESAASESATFGSLVLEVFLPLLLGLGVWLCCGVIASAM